MMTLASFARLHAKNKGMPVHEALEDIKEIFDLMVEQLHNGKDLKFNNYFSASVKFSKGRKSNFTDDYIPPKHRVSMRPAERLRNLPIVN